MALKELLDKRNAKASALNQSVQLHCTDLKKFATIAATTNLNMDAGKDVQT